MKGWTNDRAAERTVNEAEAVGWSERGSIRADHFGHWSLPAALRVACTALEFVHTRRVEFVHTRRWSGPVM